MREQDSEGRLTFCLKKCTSPGASSLGQRQTGCAFPSSGKKTFPSPPCRLKGKKARGREKGIASGFPAGDLFLPSCLCCALHPSAGSGAPSDSKLGRCRPHKAQTRIKQLTHNRGSFQPAQRSPGLSLPHRSAPHLRGRGWGRARGCAPPPLATPG